MLDLKLIRRDPDFVKTKLSLKNEDVSKIDEILSIDEKRRELISKSDELKASRNILSKSVAGLKASGNDEQAEKAISESKTIGDEIKKIDDELKSFEEKQFEILSQIPNIPSDSTPPGKDETENLEVRRWGIPREFEFDPKPHWEIGPNLQMMDFERAAKLSGSRFVVLSDKIARLERALVNFMLDTHTQNHNYTEMNVPFIVKRETMFATGQLPKFEEEAYRISPDDMFLIPTAEVYLASLHKDEILAEKELPKYYVAYSSCFRREAGSYGKDVRGMIRVHQFEKVELVKYTDSDSSFDELEKLTKDAEKILQLLELPYRVIALCTGDTGFGSALTYDLEVWLPSYGAYKEISSCSNDTDFQGRRANIRYRNKDNKLEFVHTLNGSGLAVGRTLVAILENYQNADGSVNIPKVLIPYMNGTEKIF